MDKGKIGIIGFGSMGSSLAEQLKVSYKVSVFDKEAQKTTHISGMAVAQDIRDLIRQAEVIMLAVKPQDFDLLLAKIKEEVGDRLVISIAAGITCRRIEDILGRVKVVRAMPNLPAKIGQGVTALAKGRFAGEKEFQFAEELFACAGKTIRLKEEMMNALTAVSGNGPAYVGHFIASGALDLNNIPEDKKEAFLREFCLAAQAVGFGARDAEFLVENTYAGTIAFLKKITIPPREFIEKVKSRGGSTEAAFAVLNSGGTLAEAVMAGLRRAEELSKKE